MLIESDQNNVLQEKSLNEDKPQKVTEEDLVKKLTINGIQKIVRDHEEKLETSSEGIVCQVIQIKSFEAGENKNMRTRLHISDGSSYLIAFVKRNISEQMPIFNEFSIIQLQGHVMSKLKERFVVVLTAPPKVLYEKCHLRIGAPMQYELRRKRSLLDNDFIPIIPYQAIKSHMDHLKTNGELITPAETCVMNKENISSVSSSEVSLKHSNDEYYTPIKCLTTFTYDWKIKARILKKSDIRRWRKPQSAGQLMNIELIDAEGTQILATFFNDAVDQFDHMLLENHVYVFTCGTVKIANKRFTSIKNDFSLIFDISSQIQRVEEDEKIGKQGFHFFNIRQIEQMREITTIDFIGVVHYVGPITLINLKNGTQKERRNILMADDTGLTLNLCFWGEHANMSDYPDHPVLALKSVRVSDYSGRSLNSAEGCTVLINPDMEKAQKLRKWYDSLESKDNLKCISFDASKIGKENARNNERLLGEIPQYLYLQFLRDDEKPVFIMANAIIHYIKNDDRSIYHACPEELCRRKVTWKEDLQRWRCEKCNQEYEKAIPTFVLTVKLCDFSGGLYVHFYRDLGRAIMDIDPEELLRLKQDGFVKEYNEVFQRNSFKHIKVLMKVRMYKCENGDSKINYHASRVLDHSFASENQNLLSKLELYKDRPDILGEEEKCEVTPAPDVSNPDQEVEPKDDPQVLKSQISSSCEDPAGGIPIYDFAVDYESFKNHD
ncbi:unnamed protein product [Moneuplotes crassus]|uniref:Replication protein A subunit n=1 Tax=Euplotes crassus TaxID=5936 RepID=A0AAD1U4S0_EUPCR|nr:unnamed protein product [Moneuplotes crassus]